MSRSASSVVVLTLGLAVLAAAAVSVFAQMDQNASGASSDREVRPQAETSDADASQGKERQSIRSGSLSISATPRTNPETVKEDKPPEIEVDSSNVRSIPKSAVQPIRESKKEITLTSKISSSALAEKLTDAKSETVPVWHPAFASQGFRGARLDAFAISQDGTVLAIAERTGTALGPNGTRIILFNTSNWQAIRVFTTERMLKKLAFIPESETLVAIAFPQSSRKQEFGLAFMDLADGKEQDFLQLPVPFNEKLGPEEIALTVTPEFTFCSGFFGSTVFCVPFPVNMEAEKPFHTFETVSPAAALAITPDGNLLAAASLKAIEYFDLNPATGFRRKSITSLELGWKPVDLHFLNGAQTDFILCPAYKDDSPPVFVRSAEKVSLDGRSAGFVIPMGQDRQIGVAFKVKGRIDVVDTATLDAADSAILEQLRPATTGDTAFVFYLDTIQAFCVIDTNGNCFAVGKLKDAKRWSKRIIWNGGATKR